MNSKKIRLLWVLIAVITVMSVFTVTAFAMAENMNKIDASIKIEEDFANMKIGTTKEEKDDGTIGIPVKISTFYNNVQFGNAKSGFNGTPLVIYVINTNTVRIGDKTDTEIIQSMLDRGYIVTVLDYENNEKTKSPELDYSVQKIRQNILRGDFYEDKTIFPKGDYRDSFIVPAGYDVEINVNFFAADKHGADGTLEKIVENWNTDFKGAKGEKLVKWVYPDGTRKTVENAKDGSTPVWYNENGDKNESGQYTRVKYTVANDISDCVKPNGEPLDMNLYMHIVYPTVKQGGTGYKAPVMCHALSSGYLNTAVTESDTRPHLNGYLFNGYAGVIYDYLWVPMARSENYGYYDGRINQGGETDDQMNYSLHTYNDKKINTAAMRCLRYLTLSEPEKYQFDTEAFGVFGNSKGGWMTFLGEAELKNPTPCGENISTEEFEQLIDARINAYPSKRQFENHHDETRYMNGKTVSETRNGMTICGGELQPFLTFNGKEIPSYANFIYASCGANEEDVTKGHCPIFVSLNLQDQYKSAYGASNTFYNLARNHDIPALAVVVDIGHTFVRGEEYYHGFDAYSSLFDFSDYYLKNDAVKVVYTEPNSKTQNIGTDIKFVIKFTGPVSETEIAKVKITDSKGNAVNGIFTSALGKTEWTFIPDILNGNEKYTLTVPANIKGDNGKEMGKEFTALYKTVNETLENVETVKTSDGIFFKVNAPKNLNFEKIKLNIKVKNDAANTLGVYLVSNYNDLNPELSEIGNKIHTENLKGVGNYQIDVTDYAGDKTEPTVFYVKAEKTASENIVFTTDLGVDTNEIAMGKYVREQIKQSLDGISALEIKGGINVNRNNESQYKGERFYQNLNTAFTCNNLIKNSNITPSDYGRKFTVTVRVYDTKSRVLNLILSGCNSSTEKVIDLQNQVYNFRTEANSWQDITFDYTVYDKEYGKTGNHIKQLNCRIQNDGSTESPIYVKSITVKETVTDVLIDENVCSVIYTEGNYKKPVNNQPFALISGENTTYFDSLSSVLSAYKQGDTVKLQKNYTAENTDRFGDFTVKANVNDYVIDLSGYVLTVKGDKSLLNLKSVSSSDNVGVTLKNGVVYLNDGPLVSYNNSDNSAKNKVFTVNLENLDLKILKSSIIENVLTDNKINGAETAVNFSITDCNFEINKTLLSKNPLTLFGNGEGTLSVKYNISGGNIYADTFRNVVFYNEPKKVLMTKDAGGLYTTISTSESEKAPSVTVMTDEYVGVLKLKETNEYLSKYEVGKSPLSTKYGVIPEEYSDVQKYPFVIFDGDGTFVQASENFLGNNGANGAMGDAKTLLKDNVYNGTSYGANSKEAFILQRRDYTLTDTEKFDNLAQTKGHITLDMNNFSLYQGNSSKAYFGASSKGWSATSGNKVFPSYIKVINGTINMKNSSCIVMNTWDSMNDGSIKDKLFKFEFENVIFRLEKGAKTKFLLTDIWKPNKTEVAAPFETHYKDCTFDVTEAQENSGVVLFNTACAGNFVKHNIYVNGCEILAHKANSFEMFKIDNSYGSGSEFAKGTNGKYLTLTLDKGEIPAKDVFDSKEGSLGFEKESENETSEVFTLKSNALKTEYGEIPNAYADANNYPFVLFKDGQFIGAYAKWGDTDDSSINSALEMAKSQMMGPGKENITVQVLLRSDYEVTKENGAYWNMSQIGGTLLLDLDGHTMTRSYVIFDMNAKLSAGKLNNTRIVVKNGTFASKTGAIFNFNSVYAGDAYKGDKVFNVELENVEFKLAPGANTSLLAAVGYFDKKNGKEDAGFTVNIKATNCTFDVTTLDSAKNLTVFEFNKGADKIKANIEINGGEFTGDSFEKVKLITLTSDDIYKFGNGVNGLPIMKVKANGKAPTDVFKTVSGERPFVKVNTENGFDVYALVNMEVLKTPYGNIAPEFESAQTYPFAIFANGKFVTAKSTWNDAVMIAKDNIQSDVSSKAVIFVRRDYDTSNDTETTWKYWNAMKGTLTVDLNSHKMTRGAKYIIDLSGSKVNNEVFDTNVIFKNGTIEIKDKWMMCTKFGKSLDAQSGKKVFDITFENMTFTYAEGAKAESLTVIWNGDNTVSCNLNINFSGCTFDLTNMPANTVLFKDKSNSQLAEMNVKINGGKFISPNADKIKLGHIDAKDKITFGTDKFTELVLAKGEKAPTELYDTAKGKAQFILKSEDVNNTVYVLELTEIINFVPKANIVLYTSIAYKVYIPVNDKISEITFAGKTYTDLSTLPQTEINGKMYYVLVNNMAASHAGEEFKLTVKLAFADGKTKVGSWDMSVIKYAKKILDGNYTEAEKTVVKDMLSYIKASYVYFESQLDSAESARVKAEIEKLIGADYDTKSLPNTEVPEYKQTEGLDSASLMVTSAPSFVFYPETDAEGNLVYDVSKYKFTVNGRTIKTETVVGSDGLTKIIVKTYAYEITDKIEYVIEGTEIRGEYNLKSYYESTKTGDANLKNLVERLWKYSESAKVYKASVQGN